MPAQRNFAVAATLFAGAVALATAALASGPKLSDSQYLAAAHCQGLFAAKTLGPVDSATFNSMMKSEGAFRSPEILDRADEARRQAMNLANHSGPDGRAELVSERDGACQTWAKASAGSAGGH